MYQVQAQSSDSETGEKTATKEKGCSQAKTRYKGTEPSESQSWRQHVDSGQRKPVAMQVLIDELCRHWGIDKKVKEYQALAMWPHIVGKRIAEKARPLGIQKGKLFLSVENASWRNELTFLKKDIIDKINRSVGTKVVREIVCCTDKGVHTTHA